MHQPGQHLPLLPVALRGTGAAHHVPQRETLQQRALGPGAARYHEVGGVPAQRPGAELGPGRGDRGGHQPAGQHARRVLERHLRGVAAGVPGQRREHRIVEQLVEHGREVGGGLAGVLRRHVLGQRGAFRGVGAQPAEPDVPAVDAVLDVVHRVRHVVGPVHHLRLQAPLRRLGAGAQPGEDRRVVGVHAVLAAPLLPVPRIFRAGVERGAGEVEARGRAAGPDHLGLQPGQYPQRLRVALEPAAGPRQLVQDVLAVVPERRVAQVVRQARGVGDVRVAAQPPAEVPGDLGHLQRVGEPGPQEVVATEGAGSGSFARQPGASACGVHLGLGGQPPERGRMQHAGPVVLVCGALVAGRQDPGVLGRFVDVAFGVRISLRHRVGCYPARPVPRRGRGGPAPG